MDWLRENKRLVYLLAVLLWFVVDYASDGTVDTAELVLDALEAVVDDAEVDKPEPAVEPDGTGESTAYEPVVLFAGCPGVATVDSGSLGFELDPPMPEIRTVRLVYYQTIDGHSTETYIEIDVQNESGRVCTRFDDALEFCRGANLDSITRWLDAGDNSTEPGEREEIQGE